ncbi:MAG TPA: alpha/beta fold hydrolase [Noviherbaspirillum sp.]|nr:alpha/beta fold hydrolase [Noviherbaspirillum sp.]
MNKKRHLHPSDIRALARLATDATIGLTDLVEAVHHTIVRLPGTTVAAVPAVQRTRGISGIVYNTVRGIARATGGGIDKLLAQLSPFFGESGSSPEREAVLATLNGVLGDYMAGTGNTLAIPMRLRLGGNALRLEREALSAAIPHAGSRLLVLAHGLCMNDLQWRRLGHDHGAALAHDLGYTPLYLHYNSGRHTSDNGRNLASLLQDLIREWPQPVEELVLVCHSMGGLVARSACHYGAAEGHTWLPLLRKLIFLGTPHHGAPLERIGNWIDVLLKATRYAAPFARLGKIRSAGITDLRFGNLLEEDWTGRDRFARGPDRRQLLPLPSGVQCYTVAATLGKAIGSMTDRILGDGLVPLDSALGIHEQGERRLDFTPDRQWVACETGHMDLLSSADVYARICDWLAQARTEVHESV